MFSLDATHTSLILDVQPLLSLWADYQIKLNIGPAIGLGVLGCITIVYSEFNYQICVVNIQIAILRKYKKIHEIRKL